MENMNEVKFLKKDIKAELTEKKSRFIAYVTPIKDEDEALDFIAAIKKKHYDARHNCYAYSVGGMIKSSDDGEPAHTAGRPMAEIISKEGLDNVCAVVTRYFGGILLGTGGLVRAYQGALALALSEAEYYTLSPMFGFHILCDYNDHGRLTRHAENNGFIIENQSWSDKVEFDLYVPADRKEEAREAVISLSTGKAGITELGSCLK